MYTTTAKLLLKLAKNTINASADIVSQIARSPVPKIARDVTLGSVAIGTIAGTMSIPVVKELAQAYNPEALQHLLAVTYQNINTCQRTEGFLCADKIAAFCSESMQLGLQYGVGYWMLAIVTLSVLGAGYESYQEWKWLQPVSIATLAKEYGMYQKPPYKSVKCSPNSEPDILFPIEEFLLTSEEIENQAMLSEDTDTQIPRFTSG